MKKRIQSILVENNLFVGLGVWSLVKLTGLLHHINVDFFALFSFVSTLLVYSFSILFSAGRVKGFKSLLFSKDLKVSKFIFLMSTLVLPYFLYHLKPIIILGLIPVALVSFLYPVEIVSEAKGSTTLREFPYLKIFLIGVSWGLVTVVLPLMNEGVDVDSLVVIETMVRSFFVVAITIPFDVRDVKTDPPKMKTIPQEFGIAKAKILSYALLGFNFAYYVWLGKAGVEALIFILITLLFTSLLVMFSRSNKPKYYYTIFMESTSLLLFLSFYISEIILF